MTRRNSELRAARQPRLMTGWLLWSVLAVAVAVRAVLDVSSITENDVFLHTLMGEWILQGGAVTGNPDWTYGPYEQGWVNTLVVPEIVFAQLHAWLGWGGITLVRAAAVVIAAFASWFALSRMAPTPSSRYRQLSGLIAVVATIIYIVLFGPNMSVRPQALSYALVPLLVLAAVQVMQFGRFPHIFVVALVTWIWSCWHGYGILVGPILILAAGIHFLVRVAFASKGSRSAVARSTLTALLKQSATPLAALAVTLLTPAGIGLWTSTGRIKEASAAIISEWMPTFDLVFVGGLGLAITAIAVITWVLAAFPQLRGLPRQSRGIKMSLAADAVFIIALLALFISTERTAVLEAALIFYLAAFRALRAYVPRAYKKRPETAAWTKLLGRGSRRAAWVGGAVLVLAAVTVISIRVPQVSYSTDEFPQQLVNDIVEQPGEHRVFTDWNVSSNMLYQLQHAQKGKTAFDGRTDYYGADTLLGIGMLDMNTPHWDAYFQPYLSSTDALIHVDTEAYKRLIKAGWHVQGTAVTKTAKNKQLTWAWLTAPRS